MNYILIIVFDSKLHIVEKIKYKYSCSFINQNCFSNLGFHAAAANYASLVNY